MEMHIKKVPNAANVWLSPFSGTWLGFTRPTKNRTCQGNPEIE